MMRRFYALTLLLFATISIYGFDFVVDGIKYQTSDNNVVYVEGLENPNYSGELIIPEKVTYKDKEYVVKGINGEAFMGCEGLTSLVLGNSIEDIYYWAFKDCINLASFSIPNSVEYIDEEVFVNTAWYNALPDGLIYKDNVLFGFKGNKADFKGLLDIADGTRIIAGGALKYTMNISSVNIPKSVISICQSAFFQSGITSLTIPSSVKGIYHQAFHCCNKLEKIEVESDNTVYDSRNKCNAIIETGKNQLAFGCKNTVIPNSVTSIKEFAFRGHWMKSIVIPKSIISIGSLAFMDCWRLETIYSEIEEPFKISNDVFEDYDEKTLYVPVGTKAKYEATDGWKEFKNILEMEPENKELKVGDTFESDGVTYKVTSVSPYEVQVGDGRTNAIESDTQGEIVIPTSITGTDGNNYSVTSISQYAFQSCRELTSVKLPSSLTKIESEIFQYCPKLESIVIPHSVISIELGAFFACNNLKTLKVESGNPVYDSRNDCNAIIKTETNELIAGCNSTIIPNTVTSIADYAFSQQLLITSISIPNSVVSIGEGAFWNCDHLESLVIPNSVVSIGAEAFYSISYLESLTLGNSVSFIGKGTFDRCYFIKEVRSLITEPFDISGVFPERLYKTATLYVPKGTKAKYEATDGWKDFKNIVEMVELDPIDGETTVSTENLSSEDLTDNVVNDVYYNVGAEGYDASDKSVVISQTTNMGQITDATPGSSEVNENFNGMILKVAAGKGTITVNVKTTGNAQLVVQVGNGTPMIASKTEQGDVVVSYDVAEDTYVYIYAIIGSSAAPAHRAAPADAVKIYSIKVTPGATGIDIVHSTQSTVHSCYTLDGRKLEGQPTKKGVYIVNGKKIVIR